MYLQWGPHVISNKPTDILDLIDYQLTHTAAQQTNTEVDGDTKTNDEGRTPKEMSFKLHYVKGYTDQKLEDLAVFWDGEVEQEYMMIFGGSAPYLLPNPMKLVQCNQSKLRQHADGTFLELILDLKFQEVMTDEADKVDAVTSAVDIGA